MTMPTFLMNNGIEIPALGIGTWQIPDTPPLVKSLSEAIKMGYRYIDTAAIYDNEKSVGEAIRASGVAREDLFVLSKCWTANRTYDTVMRAFDESLERLGLDYLDAYLIHWPCTKGEPLAWQSINLGTWRAFEALHDQKLIRSIGVSNFLPHHLVNFLSRANVRPALNQIEFHPGYWQKGCVEFCQREGIQVQAWSPMGHGHLPVIPLLERLAAKYEKSTAQIIFRWIYQHNVVVITKSMNAHHQAENMAIFDFALTEDEMRQIDELPTMGFSGLEPDHVSF